MNTITFNKLVKLDKRELNQNFVKFTLKFPRTLENRTHYVFVIDKSSSMHSDYHHVVEAMHHVRTIIGSDPGQIEEPSIVMYATDARVILFEHFDYQHPGGMTNFGQAFTQIGNAIKTRLRKPGTKPTAFNIVFMTDGEDTSSQDHTMTMMNFKILIDNLGLPVKINTIAFRTKAHMEYLNYIKNLGTEPGVFKYAENSAEFTILSKFKEILELTDDASSANCTLNLHMSDGTTHEQVFKGTLAEETESNKIYTFFGILPFEIATVISVETITYGKDTPYTEPYTVEGIVSPEALAVAAATPDSVPVVSATSQVTMYDLLNIIALIPATTRPEIIRMAELMKSINIFGKTIINGSGQKIMKLERDEMMAIFESIRQDLDRKLKMIANAVKIGDTTRMAAIQQDLHDAAGTGLTRFTKARIQRKMDERTIKNAQLLRDISTKLDTTPLLTLAETEDIDDEFFICDFQGEPASDLLQEEKDEILGFCLQVHIPEHAIDSCNIVVNTISPTMMTFTTFMNALKYNINAKGLETAHGGFKVGGRHEELDTESGFEGRGREKINAWLPLYINPAHFTRVQTMLPMVLGQFFTMDMRGFDTSQYLGMFLVLGYCKLHVTGERMIRIVAEYEKVCKQIHPKVLKKQGFDLSKEFFEGGKDYREKSVLNNLVTLVGLLAINPDFTFNSQTFMVFYEECLRRHLGEKYRSSGPETVMDIAEKILYGTQLVESQGIKPDAPATATPASRLNKQEMKFFNEFGSVVSGYTNLSKRRSMLAVPMFATTVPARLAFVFNMEIVDDTSASIIATLLKDFEESGSGKFCAKIALMFGVAETDIPSGAKLLSGEYTPLQALMLKTVTIQALRNYRSFSKGDADSYIETTSDPGDGTVWQMILNNLNQHFAKNRDENWEEYVETNRRKQIVDKLLTTPDLLGFGGMLMVAIIGHPTDKHYTDMLWSRYNYCSRTGKTFDLLIEKLLDPTTPNVILRNEKLQQIATGKYYDAERRAEGETFPMMEGGNAWYASTTIKSKYKIILTKDEYEFIATMTGGYVAATYGYRASGKPNRQGHCNKNPSGWAIHHRSTRNGANWV